MLRGYRLFIVAIGLVLAGPSYGQERKADKPTAQNDGPSQLERITAAIEKLPKAQAPDRGCQPGQDDRYSDLCAQWKAADAATESAKWSLWMVWLTGLGLALGSGTLFAAWRAAHWAKKAAEETKRTADFAEASAKDAETALQSALKSATATERQVSITEDTANRQLRAYVTVDHPYINNHPAEGMILEYRITATNDGVTPAKSLQWASKFTVAFDEEAANELLFDWDEAERSSAIVGAGKPIQIMGRLPSPITADYMARLENQTARIWAVGEIRYQDIFGVDRVTAYRGYYDFTRGFVWDSEGNTAT